MDGEQFDRLTRAVATASSRRGLLRGVAVTIAAGLFAADIGDAEARACRICRRGRCRTFPDGTRCGKCGACADGACVPSGRWTCGACKECNPATLGCDPLPDDTFCGDCGTCDRGRCRPNEDFCPACATCRGVRLGGPIYNCRSNCEDGARCCSDDTCAPADGCCRDETPCDDECCLPTETCTADGCCHSSRVCGTGPTARCCEDGAECTGDGVCCPLGQVCHDPGLNVTTCCAANEVCCASDFTCKPPDECCTDCNECQTCQDGECVADPARELADCGATGCGVCSGGQCVTLGDNNSCTDRNGTCCGGVCRDGAVCCDDSRCPECRGCDAGQCVPDPDKTGLECGTSGCQVCGDGQCINLSNGSDCTDRDGECCGGVCCQVGDFCCGGACCAAGKSCLNGVCGDSCPPGETPCGGACCAIGTVCCQGACCAFGETCTSDGCCPSLSPNIDRCPASGGPPEAARCCRGNSSNVTISLCYFDFVSPAACCPDPGPIGGGGVCQAGCCPIGFVCDNRCVDHLGPGVGCCHPPGLDPIPLTCENLQCSPPGPLS